MAKTLSNYNPTVNIGGGITPAGGEFPVAESHDILVDATGKRLDTKLDELDAQIGGTGETSVATQLGQKVAKSDITTGAPASTNTDAQVPSTKSMYTALATKPTGTLSTAKPVSGSTDTQIPTSKAVYTGLAEKVNNADITTGAPASTNTDAQVPSTKSMYTALATKPTGTLSTAEPTSSSTDTQIPTAKAVYTGLNKKINTADIASTVAATGSTSATKVPSETAVREAIEAKTIPLESSVPAAGDSPSATAAPSVAATRTAIDAAIDDASQDFEDAAAALQTSYSTFTSEVDAKIGDPTDAADDGATAVWPRLKNAETDIDALSGQFLITDALTTAKMADNTRFYIYTGKEIHVVNATTDITDTTGNIIYKYIGATSGNYTQNNLYKYDTSTSAYVAVTAADALNITVEGSSVAGTIYRPNYWFYYDTNTWKQGSNVSSVTVDSTLSIAGAAADAKATGDAITELSNDFQLNQESFTSLSNIVSNLNADLNTSVALIDDELYSAIGAYNDILAEEQNTNFFVIQTASTVTSGYIRNGVVVENDRFYHTDYIPVRPNTQYTSCLVPIYGAATEPGYGCATKVVFYNANKTYISESGATTFTTPINCKYIVLNLGAPGSMGLNIINAMTMLVYGSSIPTNYVSPSKTMYMNLREMFGDINNAIQNLKQVTTENGNEYSVVDAVSTSSGYRWYLASNGLVYGAPTDNQTAKVFPIISGRKYKVYGFGYDRSGFYVAYVSKYNLIAMERASIADPDAVNLLCGTDEYPAGYTYHTITFVAPYNGFVYVNSRTASDQPTLSLANIVLKTEESVKEAVDKTYHKEGVYISNGIYYCFFSEGESNIIRQFERRGPNNIFQWSQMHIGFVDDSGMHATKSYRSFGTDIVGPISIWNHLRWPNIYGMWSGGNHGKDIDGTSYATAEQISFECLVNGEVVSNNGLYYGDVRFNTVNNLYFPQSITGSDLTQAILAIKEHRYYHVHNGKMNIRVWLEFIDNVRCSLYYGMQMADIDFDAIFCANNGYWQVLSEMEDAVALPEKERRITLTITEDKLNLDMDMHNIALGEYSMNDGEVGGYVTISNHGPSGTFRKTYYRLISSAAQPMIEAGTNLYWEGDYVLYYS